jgi:excinuclease UvrABC ATPase subunit
MAHADSIIDLGPGAGYDGGRVVFEGAPADLVAARSTLTGEHLAAFVGSRPKAVTQACPIRFGLVSDRRFRLAGEGGTLPWL